MNFSKKPLVRARCGGAHLSTQNLEGGGRRIASLEEFLASLGDRLGAWQKEKKKSHTRARAHTRAHTLISDSESIIS